MGVINSTTDKYAINKAFADDAMLEDNKGIVGYDNSPEVLERAEELSRRLHNEFMERLNSIN